MTRYEHIQKMSLDELAEYLCDTHANCDSCQGYGLCEWTYPEVVHANGLKKWLKENTEHDG